ncbi:MAG: 2-hydroxyacid dehydrogenase [Candidatus Thorarchaeota archaeon]|jgi:glyoxylate reductase
MPESVFVTRKLPGTALESLTKDFNVDVWEDEFPPTPEDIVRRAYGCVGIITLLSDTIDKDLIESLPNLKIIAQYAVGYDNIDVKYATEKGILVTNTPGVLTETTADLTWALIMATSRRIVESDQYVKSGQWKVAWGPEMLLGVDVYGKTIGIIGMGRIGYAVARRSIGFNMRLLFHSRSESLFTEQAINELRGERVELDFLLKEADIISLHVPLTNETTSLISDRELSLMKTDAILINTSRGAVIDELALVEALRKKTIRCAGLDVFLEEPTPSTNPLLQLDNVVALPHIGSASVATRAKMADMCVENLRLGLSGKIPPNIVNSDVK